MICYIGLHVDGMEPWNDDKRVPISISMSRDDAQAIAIRRILSACVLDGYIAVVKQEKLTPEDFDELERITSEFFKARGIE